MLPLPAVRKVAHHASPPLARSAAYNPRLGHADVEVPTTEHEDSRSELEQYAATHASRVLSEDDFALLVGHLNFHGRIGSSCFFICDIYGRLCSQISLTQHPSKAAKVFVPVSRNQGIQGIDEGLWI